MRIALLLLALAACGDGSPVQPGEENGAPTARDDIATTLWAVPLSLGVMENDTDPDADGLRLGAVLAPRHGTATAYGDSIRYVAPGGFTGTDQFRYVVSDGQGGSDTAAVTVTVRAMGYAVEVVGTLGNWSFASDAGEDGSVAGFGYTVVGSEALRLAFVARGGTTVLLPGLGGSETVALGVNGTGTVVGASRLLGNETFHAVLWKGGAVVDLGKDLGVGSFAEDVNDADQVVGEFFDAALQSLAVRWLEGQARPMGIRGAALSITGQGQMSGFAAEPGGVRLAYTIAQAGQVGVLPALPNSGFAMALSLNDAGEAVGVSRSGSPANRAVWWRGGSVSQLPVPGDAIASRAHRINRDSQVAGVYSVLLAGDTVELGAVWHQGEFHDLTSLVLDGRWVVTGAYGITDGGMIAADGFDPATGEVRALALHPRVAPAGSAAAVSRTPVRPPRMAPPPERRRPGRPSPAR